MKYIIGIYDTKKETEQHSSIKTSSLEELFEVIKNVSNNPDVIMTITIINMEE